MSANVEADAKPATGPSSRWAVVGALVLVAAAVLTAYHNGLSGPFIFDDPSSIVANPTIRQLWPPWTALSPPNVSITAQGRPVLNFSLALNYAVSGTEVWSYHALNLAIHLLAAFTLFGLVRRTLLRGLGISRVPEHDAASRSTLLALAVALLWAVHPLQTESVSYVIQRAESLMGLFYLLTLYCFVRGAEAGRNGGWFTLAIASCLLGMATKEVMATAPLLVLLYDRTFVSGRFRDAWRRHRWLHLGLAGTWLLLAVLVIGGGGNRGGSVGLGVGIAWWAYPLTQVEAIARYLCLSVWPHPLVFEYGAYWVTGAAGLLPWALPVAAALAVTVVGLRRWPALGFLGCWFFLILAPTSLAPGTTQMIVEHRMYLPLAAIVTGVVLGVNAWIPRLSVIAFAVLGTVLVFLTLQRNEVYRSEVAIWRDTVAHRPENPLAHQMLALALDKSGAPAEAIAHYEEALRLKPNFALAHDTFGLTLFRLGRKAEAAAHFETAVRLQPGFADARDHLAVALFEQRRFSEAAAQDDMALRLKPDFAEAHYNLARSLVALDRARDAAASFEQALRLRPAYPEAHYSYANLLAAEGRAVEAIAHYEAALALNPSNPNAHYNLANSLATSGRPAEAIPHYEAALRLKPDFSDARDNLAVARAALH